MIACSQSDYNNILQTITNFEKIIMHITALKASKCYFILLKVYVETFIAFEMTNFNGFDNKSKLNIFYLPRFVP